MVDTVKARASGVERAILMTGRTGRFWGSGFHQVLASGVIPAGTIRPSSMLKLRGLLSKYAPNSGGWSMTVRLRQGANSVNLVNGVFTATTLNAPFEQDLLLSPDRKWAFSTVAIANLFGTGGNQAVGFASTNVISTSNAPASVSPRLKTRSTGVRFASYSAPPTVETVLIDFEQDITVEVTGACIANDSIELLGFRLSVVGLGEGGSNLASTKATYCPGDSLTEGTGATSEATGWVSMIAKSRVGRPFIADGLGGQKIEKIVDRVVADPICGKYWDMVFWGGINDVGSDGPTWWATVQEQLVRLMAFRATGSRHPLILNFHESTAWTAGQKTAATYVNTQLAATYGANVVDVAAIINGNASMYADDIHLNDTGYAPVASAVSATMTAQGWAA